MTRSGRASGSGQGKAGLDNLAPDHYDDFVHYLVTVVRWYRDTHNLVFRCVIQSFWSESQTHVIAVWALGQLQWCR